MTFGDLAKAVLQRLKYTAFTLAALAVVACAEFFLAFAFLLLTGLAFLGSTGRAHNEFMKPFIPFAYFAMGAVAAGGIVALVNAAVLPRPFWFRSIAAIAVLGGLVAAINPQAGPWLVGLTTPVVTKIKDLWASGQRKEEALVLEFVKRQRAVGEAVGETFRASISTTSLRDGTAFRYEIHVSSVERTVYAIVDVSRSWGRTEFSLACVTPIGYANRQSGTDPCRR